MMAPHEVLIGRSEDAEVAAHGFAVDDSEQNISTVYLRLDIRIMITNRNQKIPFRRLS